MEGVTGNRDVGSLFPTVAGATDNGTIAPHVPDGGDGRARRTARFFPVAVWRVPPKPVRPSPC